MTTDTASLALNAANDAQDKLRIMGDNISQLVDEKADMATLIRTLGAEKDQLVLELKARLNEKTALAEANERLAKQLKDVIAEKEDLRQQLAAKSGMGIHENRPGVFAEINKGS